VSTLPVAVVSVPLVPTAVEVDPETPPSAVPFRLAALVPSLLGLPLRLVCALAVSLLDVALLAVLLLIVAFDRIHPPAFAVVRLADVPCDALLPCIMQPVTVIVWALFADRLDEVLVPRDVSVCCPLLLDGADRVVGC